MRVPSPCRPPERIGGEFQVNTFTALGQRYPWVSMSDRGTFVVVWHSIQDGGGYGAVGQQFEFGEFRI